MFYDGIEFTVPTIELSGIPCLIARNLVCQPGVQTSASLGSGIPVLIPPHVICNAAVEVSADTEVGVDGIFLKHLMCSQRRVALHTFARPWTAGDTGQVVDVGFFVNFEATPLIQHDVETIQFTSIIWGVPISIYLWSFGDGETSTLRNPTHVYRNTGTYTIKLEVWSEDNEYGTYIKINYITVIYSFIPVIKTVSEIMADELAIRLEDPAGDVFSMETKLDFLNKAQVELMDVIDGNYLTELERTETGKTLTAGKLLLSDLNAGKGVFGGAEGIKMIVVKIGGAGNEIRATLVDKEDIKEFENPWFAPGDTRPAYYVNDSKIYVLVKTYLNTTIDVSYIAAPALMTRETAPDLSPMLCGLIITLAEATGWTMEGKKDRKETARQHAFKQINFLNDRMFADPDRFEPILFEYGRPKPASAVLKRIDKYPYPNIYTKFKERAFR